MKAVTISKINKSFTEWHWSTKEFDSKLDKYMNNIDPNQEDLEYLKKNGYEKNYCNKWFWRNKDQQEIDYIEESDGKISAFEFKWNPHKKVTPPKSFIQEYKRSFEVITPDNIDSFLL
jgi:hypothetical protein